VDAERSVLEPSGSTQLDLAIQRLRDEADPVDVTAPVARFGSAF
jgi:hypothetical protein